MHNIYLEKHTSALFDSNASFAHMHSGAERVHVFSLRVPRGLTAPLSQSF